MCQLLVIFEFHHFAGSKLFLQMLTQERFFWVMYTGKYDGTKLLERK